MNVGVLAWQHFSTSSLLAKHLHFGPGWKGGGAFPKEKGVSRLRAPMLSSDLRFRRPAFLKKGRRAWDFEEAAEAHPRPSAGLAEAWVCGRLTHRSYCAGIATARPVRIDSLAASMISFTPTLIAAETGPSISWWFRMQYKK